MGKTRQYLFVAWSHAASFHFNQREILTFFIFLKPWGHCKLQPLYFVLPVLQTESWCDLLLMFEWISVWAGIPNVDLVSHTK